MKLWQEGAFEVTDENDLVRHQLPACHLSHQLRWGHAYFVEDEPRVCLAQIFVGHMRNSLSLLQKSRHVGSALP